MEIEISQALFEEKIILRNLMQYYLYEFSMIDSEQVDESGAFDYQILDHYWTDPDRYPFLVRVDGKLAGFALLRRGSYFPAEGNQSGNGMMIAEFFVMNIYRRQGVGTRVAMQLYNRFPGRWEVAQMADNLGGQAFWRSVISEYCRGDFTEIVLDNDEWKGPVQVFDNSTLSGE
jgi:predicted acetyltransferase